MFVVILDNSVSSPSKFTCLNDEKVKVKIQKLPTNSRMLLIYICNAMLECQKRVQGEV
jgi:hypothetical protein